MKYGDSTGKCVRKKPCMNALFPRMDNYSTFPIRDADAKNIQERWMDAIRFDVHRDNTLQLREMSCDLLWRVKLRKLPVVRQLALNQLSTDDAAEPLDVDLDNRFPSVRTHDERRVDRRENHSISEQCSTLQRSRSANEIWVDALSDLFPFQLHVCWFLFGSDAGFLTLHCCLADCGFDYLWINDRGLPIKAPCEEELGGTQHRLEGQLAECQDWQSR